MTISPDEITIQKKAIVHSNIVLVNWRRITKRCGKQFVSHKKTDIPVIIVSAIHNDMVVENTIIDNIIDYITPNETEAGPAEAVWRCDIESGQMRGSIK